MTTEKRTADMKKSEDDALKKDEVAELKTSTSKAKYIETEQLEKVDASDKTNENLILNDEAIQNKDSEIPIQSIDDDVGVDFNVIKENVRTDISDKLIKIPLKTGAKKVRDVIVGFSNLGEKSTKADFDETNVISQFDELDMITLSAIAIMLSETKARGMSPYINNMKKADVGVIILDFCKETYKLTDIEQIDKLFNKLYYKRKVKKHLHKAKSFVKKGISDTMTKAPMGKARKTVNVYLDKITETINNFEAVKYISALSGNNEFSDSKRNYKLDHLSENYKDGLIYIVDVLLTATCISKMLFVERMVKNLDENSEFYRIIRNMTISIPNHNLIISKLRPIYQQYYRAELGYLTGDDLLYGLAITIIVNKIKKSEEPALVKNNYNLGASNLRELSVYMNEWLDTLAKENNTPDIGQLILQKVYMSIKGNYALQINALAQFTSWETYYKNRVNYYTKEKEKERYLKGDFSLEEEVLRTG